MTKNYCDIYSFTILINYSLVDMKINHLVFLLSKLFFNDKNVVKVFKNKINHNYKYK